MTTTKQAMARIELRVSAQHKDLFVRAAKARGMDLTNYLLSIAVPMAQQDVAVELDERRKSLMEQLTNEDIKLLEEFFAQPAPAPAPGLMQAAERLKTRYSSQPLLTTNH